MLRAEGLLRDLNVSAAGMGVSIRNKPSRLILNRGKFKIFNYSQND